MEREIIKPQVYLLGMSNTLFNEEPETVIALAAKLCYSSSNIEDLASKQTTESVKNFINKLSEMGHQSPVEHLSFTFGIEGVSRSFLAQMTRHRIASYSVQSQRYVDLKDTYKYITPDEIANDEEIKKIYDETNDIIFEKYKMITKMLTKKYVENGMDVKKASKKAIEDARFILPNACETKMVVTMNARSLLNFFTERCCNRAQWEIRDVAYQMLNICVDKAPEVFRYAGPSCAFGHCKEGSMSCGEKQSPTLKQLEIGK